MAKPAVAPVGNLSTQLAEACIGIGLISPDDRWLDANPYLCGLLGYSRDELVGLDRARITEAEDLAQETSRFEAVRRGTEKSAQLELRYRTRHGAPVWVSVVVAPQKPVDHGNVNLVVVVQDIAAPRDSLRAVGLQHLVSRLLLESGSSPDALQRILGEVGVALRSTYAALWNVDPAGDTIRSTHTWIRPGASVPDFDQDTRSAVFRKGEGFVGLVWEFGRPYWESDMVAHAVYPRSSAAKRSGLHAAFGFPIRTSRAFFGVMEFLAEEVLPPDHALLEAAEGVGYQLGQYLEKSRATAAQIESDLVRASIVDLALDCIITSDHRGVITEFNPAAEATFGYTKQQVLGRQMVDLIVPPSLRERHLRGLERYLKTGEARVLGRRIEITGMRSDGSEFPVELAIVRAPVEGPPVFTAYLRDLTERKKIEAEQAFLLRASEQLASSLDYETTIASIAQLAVPAIADWCAVDVVERDRTTKRVAVAHQDPSKVAFVQALREKYPDNPDSETGVPRVIRTGEPQLVREIPDSMLVAAARDAEHLEIIRSLGLRSYLVVPLKVRGTNFGALTLVYAESGRLFEDRDLNLATELARR
ncbi:MAG TPA: PAS domain S-box protein, partial [Gemmatimonadaceae bacterium]|nr:PAS domain S-box protein [Gemmatimonadaceae bacterium]